MKKKLFAHPVFLSVLILAVIFAALGAPLPGRAQSPDPTPATELEIAPDLDAVLPELPELPAEYVEVPGAALDLQQAIEGGGGCNPQNNRWVTRAPLPQALYGNGVASDGTYIYSFGGYTSSATGLAYRYDLLTNSWAVLPGMPTARYSTSAVYANGKIYVLGGLNSSNLVVNVVEIYDIASNSWSSGVPMPDVRQQVGAAYSNGVIYVVGGYPTGGVSSAQNQTWAFNIAAGSWSSKANMPESLGGVGVGIVNGVLYIMGGRNPANFFVDSVYRYDIASNAWSSGAPMPQSINSPGSAVYNGQIWIMGGGQPFLNGGEEQVEAVQAVNLTQIYNPRFDTWHSGPVMNTPRSFQGAAVVHGQIVSVGGYSDGNSAVVESILQQPLKILIVYSDEVLPRTLQTQLLAQPGVGSVDLFYAHYATPDLTTLTAYDVVITISNYPFIDPAALGDRLAAYHDYGGVVVNFAYSFYDGYQIGGLWESNAYSAFATTSTLTFSDASLGAYTVGHPLMAGVSTLNSIRRLIPVLNPGATLVAIWNDSRALLAVKNRAVGVNAYLGDLVVGGWSGDYARLVVNAGLWLRGSYTSCLGTVCSKGATVSGALTAADATTTTRLFRNIPASSCAVPQTCSTTSTGTYYYDLHWYMNNDSNPQCVTVTLDPQTCTGSPTYLHSAAYTAFNSSSICDNYLADIGDSPSGPASYSFVVQPWQTYSVMVGVTTSGGECPGYRLTVKADNCSLKHNFLPVTLR